ncbi:hypothetical protein EVAR_86842_1 [Eumeta japonica]|uniref:Uncharacterized protein n=1 Tax=Eumeta variegata TaxID=151549 RepID=A0A4C1VU52_EUMVA|nr:hypothetical protein EVAR_86842_1 [Eumeta japonica]
MGFILHKKNITITVYRIFIGQFDVSNPGRAGSRATLSAAVPRTTTALCREKHSKPSAPDSFDALTTTAASGARFRAGPALAVFKCPRDTLALAAPATSACEASPLLHVLRCVSCLWFGRVCSPPLLVFHCLTGDSTCPFIRHKQRSDVVDREPAAT